MTFTRSRWLFLRLLGVVYFIAFLSLGIQITGIVGEHGILPVGELLARAYQRYGASAYYNWPTVVWLSPTDAWLSALCWIGAATSLLLVAGIAPAVSAGLLWILYLSLTIAGQVFLEFQWDSLLLETGLLAVFYAPPSWRDADAGEPLVVVRWAIWFLAFKLTFLSGITKLLSGDPTWANWTALSYHYETQPLPAWTSWYMYQLPSWVHYAATGGTLFVELIAPWLIFLPARFWRTRLASFTLMTLLQVGIGGTGNYGFFNILTIVLYLSLLDDSTLARLMPRRALPNAQQPRQRAGTWRSWRVGANVFAGCLAALSVMTLFREMDRTRQVRGPFDRGWPGALLTRIAPLNSVNGYGLFRVMTTQRPEIIIEVSVDGAMWKEQEFKWQPGAGGRRPRFVEPHMPRLDWQMWFAALDPFAAQEWLLRLAERLIAGEPTVTKLLGPNPLDSRPRYVRFAYYQYHFTSSSEREKTGNWWKRDFVTYLTNPIGPP